MIKYLVIALMVASPAIPKPPKPPTIEIKVDRIRKAKPPKKVEPKLCCGGLCQPGEEPPKCCGGECIEFK